MYVYHICASHIYHIYIYISHMDNITNTFIYFCYMGCPDGSDGKEPPCNAGNLGSISGSGRSLGGGYGNPL